ncbi:TetR family transcriptional regulator [Speluncibacter jeojiensis]|uniref:TetR family transcriptional regulator n=1 Tax=Speluncibacter jeojiensis TaxID=2710754 RepID=A0A9X4RDM1_9ACTN|nr:TetR family transcriptional regulator [Rhodococcus sp. D2-41]MDG3014854.1 TetR family transcriptional regulator [Corynebacteriales bacterium D3-21]
MSEQAEQSATGSRAERKERTRQSLLDVALGLLPDRSFDSISIREVARGAGIVPTAFYRHFASMDDLGVALVEESMRMLRRMLRDARREPGARSAKASLDILVRQVHAHEAQFRFLNRERHGGVAEVRRAIATELRLLVSELTVDLSRMPALADWQADDLDTAADLIVSTMLSTVGALLDVGRRGGHEEQLVVDRAERQLRMIMLGMAGWRPGRV